MFSIVACVYCEMFIEPFPGNVFKCNIIVIVVLIIVVVVVVVIIIITVRIYFFIQCSASVIDLL
jgi:hypothetical protein